MKISNWTFLPVILCSEGLDRLKYSVLIVIKNISFFFFWRYKINVMNAKEKLTNTLKTPKVAWNMGIKSRS